MVRPKSLCPIGVSIGRWAVKPQHLSYPRHYPPLPWRLREQLLGLLQSCWLLFVAFHSPALSQSLDGNAIPAHAEAANAQIARGQSFLENRGIGPEHLRFAQEWFEKAAQQGNPEGQFRLARLCERLGNHARAKDLFEAAATQGHVSAQTELGLILLFGDSRFTLGDINNASALCSRIYDGKDAVSAFLKSTLPEGTIDRLSAWRKYGPALSHEDLLVIGLATLNRAVQGENLYLAERFSLVTLDHSTQLLIARNPKGLEMARLHRYLLEDAYPSALARSHRLAQSPPDSQGASYWLHKAANQASPEARIAIRTIASLPPIVSPTEAPALTFAKHPDYLRPLFPALINFAIGLLAAYGVRRLLIAYAARQNTACTFPESLVSWQELGPLGRLGPLRLLPGGMFQIDGCPSTFRLNANHDYPHIGDVRIVSRGNTILVTRSGWQVWAAKFSNNYWFWNAQWPQLATFHISPSCCIQLQAQGAPTTFTLPEAGSRLQEVAMAVLAAHRRAAIPSSTGWAADVGLSENGCGIDFLQNLGYDCWIWVRVVFHRIGTATHVTFSEFFLTWCSWDSIIPRFSALLLLLSAYIATLTYHAAWMGQNTNIMAYFQLPGAYERAVLPLLAGPILASLLFFGVGWQLRRTQMQRRGVAAWVPSAAAATYGGLAYGCLSTLMLYGQWQLPMQYTLLLLVWPLLAFGSLWDSCIPSAFPNRQAPHPHLLKGLGNAIRHLFATKPPD